MSAFRFFFEEGTGDVYYRSKQSNIILFRDAGWHFSSILDDKGIAKKMSGAADYNPDYLIQDFREFRTHSPHPKCYFGFTWPEDNEVPPEIWKKDIYKQFIVEKDSDHYHYLRNKNEKNKPWEKGYMPDRPMGDFELMGSNQGDCNTR